MRPIDVDEVQPLYEAVWHSEPLSLAQSHEAECCCRLAVEIHMQSVSRTQHCDASSEGYSTGCKLC